MRLPQVIAVKFQRYLIISLLPVLLSAVTVRVTAQSSDQSLPTPVLTNEVEGSITPLDLGDSRLTRHFYAFEGKPGDLIINVNSRNLNGDMDVFTAVTYRPLIKISIYANTGSPEVTKSFYLRTKQILILRVEARSPNDDAGTYRIRFSGAFAPFSGGIPVAETRRRKHHRHDPRGPDRQDRLPEIRAGGPRPLARNQRRQKRKLPRLKRKNQRKQPAREKRSPP